MQLDRLTDQDVQQALANPSPDNPIACAVAAAVESYTFALQRQSKRVGGWPSPLRIAEPTNAVERFALRLFVEELRRGAGADIEVRFR